MCRYFPYFVLDYPAESALAIEMNTCRIELLAAISYNFAAY